MTAALNRIGWALLSIGMFLWSRWNLIAVLAVYSAVIWAAAYYYPEKTEVFYVATRLLDRNRRLVPDDIQRPNSGPGSWGWFLPDRDKLEGKYVTKAIPQGAPIEPDKLKSAPDLIIDDGHRLVIFPLDRQQQLSDLLNANSYVDVMGADPAPVAPKVRVHAIVCPKPRPGDKNTAACYAILDFTDCKESAVRELLMKNDKKASLRPVPTDPPRK